jgi:hypothetical protein
MKEETMKQTVVLLGLVVALSVMFTVNQAELLTADAGAGSSYIGVSKCKMCHKGEKKGNHFEIWSASDHAGAYNTLATDEAKAVAAKLSVDDPQKDDKCLKCHVTAFGVDASLLGTGFKVEDGVQCEACHGPGSQYKSIKVMKALADGTQDAAAVGLTIPDEKTCVTCHNEESPTFKAFTFAEHYKKIEHKTPEKPAQ